MSRKLPIFYSALLLTAVNLILRFVGTSFQVYLSSRIGAEGIGLLQLVLSVGSMALVAGMAGIRTATMYLTAEELGKKRPGNITWVLSGCTLYSLLCSCGVGILVYIFAPFLADRWIGNSDVVDSLRLFAYFLPVNCLTGVMVGYFTGANRITTLAAVEVMEQLCNIVCTILLLQLWAENSPEKACMAVIIGSGFGSCLTLGGLLLLRLMERAKKGPRIPTGMRLLDTAVPLAVADDLRTGISTVENLMVPKRLALYPGSISPLAAFGTICGMVFPILMFPAAILFGLTELLVPELARCRAAKSDMRIQYLVRKSLRVALIYGTMCAGILFLCGDKLCLSLYGREDAGKYLRWFSVLAVMLYCDAVTDAMIKGLGQQKASVRYNIFTNLLDVSLLYILLPRYGIAGYFLSFLVTHMINFILSIRRLIKISRIQMPLHVPVVTISAGIASAWVASFISHGLLQTITYTAMLLCFLFLSNILDSKDLVWVKGLVYKK